MPCKQRELEGDRVLVVTKDPVVAAQRITTWAVDHDVDLGHFSVSQPSLEDIYLELTGSVEEAERADSSGGGSMSAIATTSLKTSLTRDLGLVAWQIRYEQRAYWRNRSRGIFTFAFPLMFLVIFASLDKGAHIKSIGGIPYDDFFVPGILAYGIIATTYVNMAISTAILRDQGVLKRMQGTPLPRWAYIAARIGSTVVIVLADDRDHAQARRDRVRGPRSRVDAARADPHARAGDHCVHYARDRGHALHPECGGRPGGHQPDDPAVDVHLEHLVPCVRDA